MQTKLIFIKKSAIAREIHKGADPKNPIIGDFSKAQEMSFEGSKKPNVAEKAIKKNNTVSSTDPKKDEINGAFHHLAFLNLWKIEISNSCEVRKAEAEAIAILKVTNGPKSPYT